MFARKGRPVPILHAGASGSWELDLKALQTILLDGSVRDTPVVVVSVAGIYRRGKSFLLSFFLRYLKNRGRGDWLGRREPRLQGFPWRGGSERYTTGILLWDEVFLVTTPEGKKLAVLLMDTQGTFDCETSMKQGTIVFALSMLISSVQVYNLSGNIDESDLQDLQFFAEYGRLAQKGGNNKPFQKLMFLVRDWYYTSDAKHGNEGGQKIIEKRLQITRSQPEELQQLRRCLKSSFLDIDCFLMPYPGPKVTESSTFDGRVSDMDPDFTKHLEDFVSLILAPDCLQVKLINGQEVTCRELASFIQSCMRAFTGNELPEPKSAFHATAEANNLAAVKDAEEFYKKEMEKILKLDWSSEDFEQEHRKLCYKAVGVFQGVPKFGGDMLNDKYIRMLTEKLERLYLPFKAQNEQNSRLFFRKIARVFRRAFYWSASLFRNRRSPSRRAQAPKRTPESSSENRSYPAPQSDACRANDDAGDGFEDLGEALKRTPESSSENRSYPAPQSDAFRANDDAGDGFEDLVETNEADDVKACSSEVTVDSILLNSQETKQENAHSFSAVLTGASDSGCAPTCTFYQDLQPECVDDAVEDSGTHSTLAVLIIPAVAIILVPALYFSPVGISLEGLCALLQFCITFVAASLVMIFVLCCMRCRGDISQLRALFANATRGDRGDPPRPPQSGHRRTTAVASTQSRGAGSLTQRPRDVHRDGRQPPGVNENPWQHRGQH